MRCEFCQGTGRIMRDALPIVAALPDDPERIVSFWQPCPECGGCGFSFCCEGDRADGCAE